MRWRIPLAIMLAAFVAVSCQEAPTAAEDSPTETAEILLDSEGNNGAIRWIPDAFCGIYDGVGDFVWNDCRNQIATFSANGNALVVVQASGVYNPTGKVVRWDAYNPPPGLLELFNLESAPAPCVLLDTEGGLTLFTVKWSGSVTPSGQATFTCHYAAQWEWEPPDGWEPPF